MFLFSNIFSSGKLPMGNMEEPCGLICLTAMLWKDHACCLTNCSLLGTLATLSNICWVTKYIIKQASVKSSNSNLKRYWLQFVSCCIKDSELNLGHCCQLWWPCSFDCFNWKTHVFYSLLNRFHTSLEFANLASIVNTIFFIKQEKLGIFQKVIDSYVIPWWWRDTTFHLW